MFRDSRLTNAQFRGSSRERPAADERRKGAQACFELHNYKLYERAFYVFLIIDQSCLPCPAHQKRTQDMQRRALLRGTLGAVTVAVSSAESVTPATAQSPIDHAPPEPLVWPALAKLPSGIRSFNGHTDTVLDV